MILHEYDDWDPPGSAGCDGCGRYPRHAGPGVPHRAGATSGFVLNRRKLGRKFLVGTAVTLCAPLRRASAQPATPVLSRAQDLTRLFPDQRELPAGVELESAGTREEIGQLAGTFRNSRDAALLLAGWGWLGNAYRSYAASPGAGRSTPARVDISLHRFASSTGAAYALAYFAHDRAVALHHQEEIGDFLLPCEAMVTSDESATRFLRRGSLVVRVTVVMPRPVDVAAGRTALASATAIALAVVANAGERGAEFGSAC